MKSWVGLIYIGKLQNKPGHPSCIVHSYVCCRQRKVVPSCWENTQKGSRHMYNRPSSIEAIPLPYQYIASSNQYLAVAPSSPSLAMFMKASCLSRKLPYAPSCSNSSNACGDGFSVIFFSFCDNSSDIGPQTSRNLLKSRLWKARESRVCSLLHLLKCFPISWTSC